MKGSGTSRCKGCVSGPAKSVSTANTTSSSISVDTSTSSVSKIEEKSSFLNKVTSPLKSPLKRSKSKKMQQQQQQTEKEPAKTEPASTVSDEKAALATITSAIASESSSSLTATANQKPGEPSTEDSSKASEPKMVKVKPAEKKEGNLIGNLFDGIVRGVQSLARPPCLKQIDQQVVGGDEHLKMKEQLEVDAKQ